MTARTAQRARMDKAAFDDAQMPNWTPEIKKGAPRPTKTFGQFEQDRASEYMPNFSLESHVSEARESMGPDRWAQLNREWESGE